MAGAITLVRLDRRRRDLPTDAGALIPQRGDPVLDQLDHGLTIKTGVAHCRIIVVARLVSPVFRVFLAALSADVRMNSFASTPPWDEAHSQYQSSKNALYTVPLVR